MSMDPSRATNVGKVGREEKKLMLCLAVTYRRYRRGRTSALGVGDAGGWVSGG
jgi:hypothetical protein